MRPVCLCLYTILPRDLIKDKLGNSYIKFGSKLCRQIVGIPMVFIFLNLFDLLEYPVMLNVDDFNIRIKVLTPKLLTQ